MFSVEARGEVVPGKVVASDPATSAARSELRH